MCGTNVQATELFNEPQDRLTVAKFDKHADGSQKFQMAGIHGPHTLQGKAEFYASIPWNISHDRRTMLGCDLKGIGGVELKN